MIHFSPEKYAVFVGAYVTLKYYQLFETFKKEQKHMSFIL
jgi:hypothetical protein